MAKHLRAADSYAKEGRLDDAMLEIQRALALDPKNYYARSFQERIRAEQEKNRNKDTLREKQVQADDEKRMDVVSQLLRNADQLIGAKNYRGALQEIAKVYKIDPKNYFATSYSDRIEALMSEEAAAGTAQPASAAPLSPLTAHSPVQSRPGIGTGAEQAGRQPDETGIPEKGSLRMYREMLKEMWVDGKLSQEESQELAKVRELFGITQQEHEEAEKQVHIEAYVDALKIAWRDGVISPTENAVLELMRQKYSITLEEHMSAEAKILWAKNNDALNKGTILIVDDDRTLLLSIAAQLKKHGYNVVTAEKIDKAIKLLEQTSPHLILSDLMFGPGEMTGMEFYQHVRSHPRFKEIPFLLMSGISDEFVFRAGLRMGVDDFLTKPFTLESLLATIEGRLRS
ncbi:MAG TPA: response regulator [Bacteroidota bacterium]|nr:response regulator [Bacteroidota bacterium]